MCPSAPRGTLVDLTPKYPTLVARTPGWPLRNPQCKPRSHPCGEYVESKPRGSRGTLPGPSHQEEARLLLRRTVELMGSCEARQLSSIAHGLAKCSLVELDVKSGALFAAVAEAAVRGTACATLLLRL